MDRRPRLPAPGCPTGSTADASEPNRSPSNPARRIRPTTDPGGPPAAAYDNDGSVAPTSRSRSRRSRQSGIGPARYDQKAGEWFGTARCAISCATT